MKYAVIKRFYVLFPVLFTLADLIALAITFVAAHWFIFGHFVLNQVFLECLLISLLLWSVIDVLKRDYKIGRSAEYSRTVNRAVGSTGMFIAIFALFWVFSDYEGISRSFLGLYFGLLFVTFSFHRTLVHMVLNRYRRWGGNFRRAVIVGYDDLGFGLYNVLNKKPEYGIRVDGFYDVNDREVPGFPKLGNIRDFLRSNLAKIDFVYVSDNVEKAVLNQVISAADEGFKKVKLLPNFQTDYLKAYSLRAIDHISVIDVNSLPLDSLLNRFVKRSFDIAFSLFVLIFLLSWMFPLFALIISLESRGPIIFRQVRHGKSNNPFVCLKFRTMVLNKDSDSKWATRNDPRVTRFGRFLRRTSLDELPQFYNVLLGEMAIVGPRPLPIQLTDIYKHKIDNFFQRHAYKPGITGLAQSMGYRGEIRELYDIKNRVKLDRFYFQNWTFFFDVKIIIKTIYALIKGQEAAY